ncbi:MAG: transcriptional repressor NrdR [Clostridiaceae bacterium]|jgi:transcriptional repressor NrdR|nr:transcriptional repressor NrdR [Clostridiaceae bacterium]HZJ91251.1 transcriptional regulator NrdR [Oscillospiraceae bacterium]
MRCPYCNFSDNKVIDSRPSDDDSTIRRRRECCNCGERFTTYERVELMPLMVIKKDGSRQPFDREKLIAGIMKSCEKRPVTTAQIEEIVHTIEQSEGNKLRREIPSFEIGELVLEQLRGIDEVAYIRFASVYREFADVSSFLEELGGLFKAGADNI